MEEQPRCYAELENDALCMVPVAHLGFRCADHLVVNPAIQGPQRQVVRRAPPPDEHRCIAVCQNGRRCRRYKLWTFEERFDRCAMHHTMWLEEQRLAAVAAAAPPPPPAPPAEPAPAPRRRVPPPDALRCTARTQAGHRCTLYRGNANMTVCGMHHRAQARAAPPPANRLAQFVQDGQNTHTAEARAILMTVAPARQADARVLEEVKEALRGHRRATPEGLALVLADVDRWWNTAQDGPWSTSGYKELLTSVWGRIRDSPHRPELVRRLYQEMFDSLGMCTQGHLTRLTNALQGFVDAPNPLSPSEILQDRMPAIAELPEAERRAAAEALLREVQLPQDAWAPWLEAVA